MFVWLPRKFKTLQKEETFLVNGYSCFALLRILCVENGMWVWFHSKDLYIFLFLFGFSLCVFGFLLKNFKPFWFEVAVEVETNAKTHVVVSSINLFCMFVLRLVAEKVDETFWVCECFVADLCWLSFLPNFSQTKQTTLLQF